MTKVEAKNYEEDSNHSNESNEGDNYDNDDNGKPQQISSDESKLSQSSSDNSESSSSSSSLKTVQRGLVKLKDLDDEVLKYLSDYSNKISHAETTVYSKLNTYIADIEDKIKQIIKFINQEFQKDSDRNERFMKNIR